MKSDRDIFILTTAKQIARTSLWGGTGIFLLFAISKIDKVMVFSAFFIFFAVLANGIMLLILLLSLITRSTARREIINTILIIIINIPIAIFYVWLSIQISELNHIKL